MLPKCVIQYAWCAHMLAVFWQRGIHVTNFFRWIFCPLPGGGWLPPRLLSCPRLAGWRRVPRPGWLRCRARAVVHRLPAHPSAMAGRPAAWRPARLPRLALRAGRLATRWLARAQLPSRPACSSAGGLGVPGVLLGAPSRFWEALGCSLGLKGTPGCSWGAPGCSWELLGCSWVLLVILASGAAL